MAEPADAEPVEAAVAAAGRQLVVEHEGALRLRDADGTELELFDAACDPLGLHASNDVVAVLCRATDELHLQVVDDDVLATHITHAREAPLPATTDAWRAPRLHRFREDFVVDLRTTHTWTVPARTEPLGVAEGRLVVMDGEGTVHVVGDERPYPVSPERWATGAWGGANGPYAIMDGMVLDVLVARLGITRGRTWAVHPIGLALVTTPDRPLAWEAIHFVDTPCDRTAE
jgi:hypothetical protein